MVFFLLFWGMLSWISLYVCVLENSICLKASMYSLLRILTQEKVSFFPHQRQELGLDAATDWGQHRERNDVKLLFHEEWTILYSSDVGLFFFFSCIGKLKIRFLFKHAIEKKWFCKHSEVCFEKLSFLGGYQNILEHLGWYIVTAGIGRCFLYTHCAWPQ